MDITKLNSIFFGLLIGFVFYFIMDKGVGHKPLIFDIIQIKIRDKKYHIHHWIIFSLLFFCALPYVVFYETSTGLLCFTGICLGSTLQGLTYRDAFKL